MIQPVEMKETRPIKIHDGRISTTTDVWNMLSASQHGDLARVTELVQRCPGLMTCEYDYTAPLHLAVREGHLDIVRYLVGLGALDPTYETHPFRDSLVTVAEDRSLDEIAQFLKQSLIDAKLTRAWGDTGGPRLRPGRNSAPVSRSGGQEQARGSRSAAN
jgi:ankyrin repeat protein